MNRHRGLLLIFFFFLVCFVRSNHIKDHFDRRRCSHLGSHQAQDDFQRQLLVLTCETRPMKWEVDDLFHWNVTSQHLREREGLTMLNICEKGDWNGFITKARYYLNYLTKHLQSHSFTHVLITDSDTFWSAQSVNHIWNSYDCARQGKDLVFSTESSCWLDHQCSKEEIQLYYPYLFQNRSQSLQINSFINTGVIMGRKDLVLKMMEYIVNVYSPTVEKFNDQYAMVNYTAERLKPEEFAIDTYQFLSSACLLVVPASPGQRGFYTCLTSDQTIHFHQCVNYPVQDLMQEGYFMINSETCLAEKRVTKEIKYRTALEEMSLTPILWHGMGKMKRYYLHLVCG